MIPMSLGALAVSVYVDHTGIDTGARTAIGKLEQFGRTLQQRGLSQFFIGVSIAMPLKRAIEDAAAFDKQMRYVATVTKDTEKHMGAFTEGIKDMSIEFGESTQTLALGLYDLLQAQFEASKVMGILRVAQKGAIGGMTDTAVAAKAVREMLHSYRLEAEYATDISDWLFKTVEVGDITYEQLASRIGFVASSAHSTGVSLEDLGAAIATITHVGLPAETTIVALNNILKQFMKPSKEAAELARQLGFEMNTATIKAWGLKGVFDRLKEMDPETIAKLFPNIRALRGAIPAIKGIEDYSKFIEDIADRAGAADRAFKKMSEGNPLWLFLSRMGQSIIAISRAIGEALAPELLALAGYFLESTRSIIKFIGNNRWIIVTLAAVSAAMMTSGIGLLTLGLGFRVVALMARTLTRTLTYTWRALAFLTTPIGLVVGLLVVVGAAIVQLVGHGDTFGEKLRDIADRIIKWVVPAIERMRNQFDRLAKWFGPIWTGIKGAAAAGLAALGEIIDTGLRGLWDMFGGTLTQIGQLWKNFWVWLGDVVSTMFPYSRDQLVEDLKYLELAFKHWAVVTELAVTTWASAVVTAFLTVKHELTSVIRKLQVMWKWSDPKAILEDYKKKYGRVAGPLKAMTDFMKDIGEAGGDRVVTDLEKGLKLRIAELEKKLGEDFAKDLLAPKPVQLPVIPELAKQEELAKRVPKKQFDDLPEGGGPGGFSNRLAALAERGTAEAYSIITQQDPMQEVANNTKKMVNEQKITNKHLRGAMVNGPYGVGLSPPVDLNLVP